MPCRWWRARTIPSRARARARRADRRIAGARTAPSRTRCAAVDPGLDQLAQPLLGAGRRRAAGAGMPAIGHQVVLGHVLVELGEIAPAVAAAVLELAADLADGLAFPRHLARRELPARMPRDAAVTGDLAGKQIDVPAGMAGRAGRAGHAGPVRAAFHRRLGGMMVVALERMIAGGGGIHSARAGGDPGGPPQPPARARPPV